MELIEILTSGFGVKILSRYISNNKSFIENVRSCIFSRVVFAVSLLMISVNKDFRVPFSRGLQMILQTSSQLNLKDFFFIANGANHIV